MLPALCQSCGRRGRVAVGSARAKERWCRCPKGKSGPYVSPPGHVTVFHFRSKADAEFRERCRLLGNAERRARDALSGRFVRCGRGWRELPRSAPKRRVLETNYREALRALEKVQALCPHAERSMFAPVMCGVCYAHVECDVAHHAHLIREIGSKATARLAV